MNGLYIKEESRSDMASQLTVEEMRIKLGTDECKICSGDYHQQIDAYVTRFHSSSEQTTIKVPVKFCPNCGRKLN